MKFIKCLGNILCSLILLFIVISGIYSISIWLERLGVGFGVLNYVLTISLSAFSFYMFSHNIDNIYGGKKKLSIAKNVFSLDYTDLKNISKIDFDDNYNFNIYLKNGLHISLNKYYIPKTQKDLQNLDDEFNF
ncbi:MAG: hypothetical protein U0M00_01600 [Clostridia bacterium]|nr:hypothetical protein [Clostridia bacterium]